MYTNTDKKSNTNAIFATIMQLEEFIRKRFNPAITFFVQWFLLKLPTFAQTGQLPEKSPKKLGLLNWILQARWHMPFLNLSSNPWCQSTESKCVSPVQWYY